MTKVEKYIYGTVLQSTLMVLLILSVMQVFILFFLQLGDVGIGDFHWGILLKVILLRMPYEVILCFPIICLIGSLIGLSQLAHYSELIVLRANGLSILDIFKILAKFGLILIFIVMLFSELLVPKMLHKSSLIKMEAMNGGQILKQDQSVWFRHKQDFWFVGNIETSSLIKNLTLFSKNHNGALKSIFYFNELFWEQGYWKTKYIEKTFFDNKKINRAIVDKKTIIDFPLTPHFFKNYETTPEQMTLTSLWLRIQQFKKHQDVSKDELVLYQRLLQPLDNMLMIFLAIPFVFGSLRSSSMGEKLLIGTVFGFGFYIFKQLFGVFSQVYQISPCIGAFIPTLIFCLIGVIILKRAF